MDRSSSMDYDPACTDDAAPPGPPRRRKRALSIAGVVTAKIELRRTSRQQLSEAVNAVNRLVFSVSDAVLNVMPTATPIHKHHFKVAEFHERHGFPLSQMSRVGRRARATSFFMKQHLSQLQIDPPGSHTGNDGSCASPPPRLVYRIFITLDSWYRGVFSVWFSCAR